MQLGRSYSRRLKSVKYDINELYPSARHAYNTIGPAVKTSRPLTQLSVFSCRFSVLVNLKLGTSPEGMSYDKDPNGWQRYMKTLSLPRRIHKKRTKCPLPLHSLKKGRIRRTAVWFFHLKNVKKSL